MNRFEEIAETERIIKTYESHLTLPGVDIEGTKKLITEYSFCLKKGDFRFFRPVFLTEEFQKYGWDHSCSIIKNCQEFPMLAQADRACHILKALGLDIQSHYIWHKLGYARMWNDYPQTYYLFCVKEKKVVGYRHCHKRKDIGKILSYLEYPLVYVWYPASDCWRCYDYKNNTYRFQYYRRALH